MNLYGFSQTELVKFVLKRNKKGKKELGYQIWTVGSVRAANSVQINFQDTDDAITLRSRGFGKRFNSF